MDFVDQAEEYRPLKLGFINFRILVLCLLDSLCNPKISLEWTAVCIGMSVISIPYLD
jgi:hypothetical protein